LDLDDSLAVIGSWADVLTGGAPGAEATAQLPRDPVEIDSHGDHRIAMSMALVGLRRPGLHIGNPQVVAKSYPGFWDDLAMLLGGANR
jgi:5-enolpyruvylshikimate-3-phosphate synthase